MGAAIGVGSSNRTPQSLRVASQPRSFRVERGEIDHSAAASDSITKSSFSRNALIYDLVWPFVVNVSVPVDRTSSFTPRGFSLPLVVFQNEPSSIIAYALASVDYRTSTGEVAS